MSTACSKRDLLTGPYSVIITHAPETPHLRNSSRRTDCQASETSRAFLGSSHMPRTPHVSCRRIIETTRTLSGTTTRASKTPSGKAHRLVERDKKKTEPRANLHTRQSCTLDWPPAKTTTRKEKKKQTFPRTRKKRPRHPSTRQKSILTDLSASQKTEPCLVNQPHARRSHLPGQVRLALGLTPDKSFPGITARPRRLLVVMVD